MSKKLNWQSEVSVLGIQVSWGGIYNNKKSTTGKSHTTLSDSYNSRLAVWHWLHTYPSTIPETTPHLSWGPGTVLEQHMPMGRKMKVKEKLSFSFMTTKYIWNVFVNHTLSKPFSSNLLPRTSPIPASAITDFSPMGSATKSLCFCDVDDIVDLY